MSLIQAMRAAISNDHIAIEKTPFSIAMMSGGLTRKEYANGLAQLWHIHNGIETVAPVCQALQSFFNSEMIRTAAIDRDLRYFGFEVASFSVLDRTSHLMDLLTSYALDNPLSILGALYVMEGSRMGSLVIAKPLARTLGLVDGKNGIEYHVEGAASTPMRVRTLKEKIENAGFDEIASNSVIRGAVEFMSLLNRLYQDLPVGIEVSQSLYSTIRTTKLAS